MSGQVTIIKGDIFDSDAQTIVNTVNCAGVMGKGLALEFKKRFPDMFKGLREALRARRRPPGTPISI